MMAIIVLDIFVKYISFPKISLKHNNIKSQLIKREARNRK